MVPSIVACVSVLTALCLALIVVFIESDRR